MVVNTGHGIHGTCTRYWRAVNWTQRSDINFLHAPVNVPALLAVVLEKEDHCSDSAHHTHLEPTSCTNVPWLPVVAVP